ncbi:MAG TPA: hypothetical protein PLX06_13990 [Fimbriimonadaceae bacterium]|nr:hypothetical protein [Fimbriimonadaceae bacterium]
MIRKIRVRAHVVGEWEKFAIKWEAASHVGWPAPFELTWPSSKLLRFLSALRSAGGRANVEIVDFEFNEELLSRSKWFELKGKQVHVSDADAEWRFQESRRLAVENPTDPAPIKIFRNMVLSRVKGAEAGARFIAGQFDLFLPHRVTLAALRQGLKGFVAHPLCNHRGKINDVVDFWEISSLLPPLAESPLSDRFVDDEGVRCFCPERLMAFRAEDFEREALDFNRTRESCGGFHTSRIVVTSMAREFFARNAVEGLSWRPVFNVGSRDFDDTCGIWSRFKTEIGVEDIVEFL